MSYLLFYYIDKFICSIILQIEHMLKYKNIQRILNYIIQIKS